MTSPPLFVDRILGETLLQTYLPECLTLHETVCNITAYVKFYEVPALSAELVCKMLQLKPAGGSEIRTSEYTVQPGMLYWRAWASRRQCSLGCCIGEPSFLQTV